MRSGLGWGFYQGLKRLGGVMSLCVMFLADIYAS